MGGMARHALGLAGLARFCLCPAMEGWGGEEDENARIAGGEEESEERRGRGRRRKGKGEEGERKRRRREGVDGDVSVHC